MKSQDISDFEKFSLNLDLLRHLFAFLDIGDQLRLANVSQQLKFAFRNFIWREVNCKIVKVKKYTDTIHLRNYNNCLNCDLSYEEYEYFINIFGLHESHGNALKVSQHLRNLRSIKYSYLLVNRQHIQSLADTCPNLESLCITGCCNKRHEILRLGSDIELDSLLAMSSLKSFSLKTGLNYKMKYGFAEDLVKKIKIPLKLSSSIESLNIYMPTLATSFLGLFSQLHTLTITVFCNVTNSDIIGLNRACTQLKELTFHFTAFENIERFSILQNLKNFFFYNCEGLTYENLKDILTHTRLITFTSVGTNYAGLFHYYFLTPTLKSIYIDAIKPFDFKTEMEFFRSQKQRVL